MTIFYCYYTYIPVNCNYRTNIKLARLDHTTEYDISRRTTAAS